MVWVVLANSSNPMRDRRRMKLQSDMMIAFLHAKFSCWGRMRSNQELLALYSEEHCHHLVEYILILIWIGFYVKDSSE
jgi:hypothetical protein